MNLPAGRPGAVALLLAAGLVAALIAAVFAFAPGVGAHPCTSGMDMHKDFRGSGVACTEKDTHDDPHEHTIEVDGGRHRDLVLSQS